MLNTSVKLRKMYLLIVITLLLLTTKPAHAVVGNITLVSSGEPIAEATISFQTTDGQVVAEGETDDDGKVTILIPDSHKGQTLILVATKGDRTTKKTVNVDRDDLKIALFLPAAGGAGVHDGYEFSAGVSCLYTLGNFDGSHDYVSGGLSESGDLDLSGLGVGVNFQVRPPSDFMGGLPCFLDLDFAFFSNVDDDAAQADYHPPVGSESYVSAEQKRNVKVIIGYDITEIEETQFSLLAGVQFTDIEASFTTDETGGGGTVNRFSDSETMASPVVGIKGTRYIKKNWFIYGSFYLTWMGDISGNGTSTLGFNYDYEVDGGFQTEFQLGAGIHF